MRSTMALTTSTHAHALTYPRAYQTTHEAETDTLRM
jgi:hypothetical protein